MFLFASGIDTVPIPPFKSYVWSGPGLIYGNAIGKKADARNSGISRGFEAAGNLGKAPKHFWGKRKSEQSRVRGEDREDVEAR